MIKGAIVTMAPLIMVACQMKTEDPRKDDRVLRIAVATNFERAMTALEPEFEVQSGYDIQASYGSSGKLYAQIRAGAPFDIFLSADQDRAGALSDRAVIVPFTYAYGKLALFAKDDRLNVNPEMVLRRGDYRRLSIANADLAPYGVASVEVLKGLGVFDRLADKIVSGENVGQAYALIATGNAELGFVAATYLKTAHAGSYWNVPQTLYTPIAQDAVTLTDTKASIAFSDYLQSEPAKALIRASGYDTP